MRIAHRIIASPHVTCGILASICIELVCAAEPPDRAGTAPTGVAVARVEVSVVAPPELDGLGATFEEVRNLLFLSMVPAAVAGAVAAPVGIAYAASLTTLDVGGQHIEGRRPAAVGRAVGEVNLASETRSHLERYLRNAGKLHPEQTGGYVLELEIGRHGFMAKPESQHACFFVEATLVLNNGIESTRPDPIIITPTRRSLDAPPAYCTRRQEFEKSGAALVHRTLEETAVILAAIVALRLGAPL